MGWRHVCVLALAYGAAAQAASLDEVVARLDSDAAGGDGPGVRMAAARAYVRYQHTSETAARRLFVTHAGTRGP